MNAGGMFVYLPLVLRIYPPPSNWVTIISEDFEGSFPGSWSVSDSNGASYGEYYWGKRNCRPYAGSYSGWGVGGGANGASLSCGSNYPNNARSWMVYGPFSLADATDGDLSFKLWLNTELGYDSVCRWASINGSDFYGTCTSGDSSGWIDRVLDLKDVYILGNLMGQPNVWVALYSYSDSSVTRSEGGYVDNVVLRKYASAAGMKPPAMSGVAPDPGNAQIVDIPTMMILTK
ncbi:MAG: hypothetical protein IMY86_13365 [Chloroflexi bacterium]|nr:hypothetical protein [Chloroflexota bacterium]